MTTPTGKTIAITALTIGIIAIVLSGLSLLTAFTPAAAGPRTQRFTIIMGEQIVIGEAEGGDVEVGEYHKWEPGVLTVKQGDTVIVEVKNPRKAIHSFVLSAYGIDTGDLQPRTGSQTIQFVADNAGVFKFQCGVPHDHEKNRCNLDHEFMVGYLVVTA